MLPRLSFCALALAILVTFTCRPAAADMLINPNNPAVDQRFYPSPTNLFWAASYNLTGVGNTNGTAGNGQWVTAISANYGLTSSHYAAAGTATPILTRVARINHGRGRPASSSPTATIVPLTTRPFA